MLEFIAYLLAILTLRKVFSYVKYGNVEKKVIKAVFSRSELLTYVQEITLVANACIMFRRYP